MQNQSNGNMRCLAMLAGLAIVVVSTTTTVTGENDSSKRQTVVDPLGTPQQVAAKLAATAGQTMRGPGSMDIGEIAVLQDTGFLVDSFGTGRTNTINIVNAFYETHGDEYDQLIIHVASTYSFDVEPEAGFAFFQISAGFTGGINRFQGIPNEPIGFTRLGGWCNMNDLPEYVDDPTEDFFGGNVASYVEILGQEFGHQYLAFVQPHPSTGADILGRGNAHWSFFLHHPGVGNASPLEGNRWMAVIGGFQTVESFTGFSELDEYLMGLRAQEDVSPFYVLDFVIDPFSDSRFPALGVLEAGIPIDLTVQDIVDNHGPRGPSVETAPKRIKVAFILVNAPLVPVDNNDLIKLDNFRLAWETYFNETTQGLGIMDTTLGLPPSVDPLIFYTIDDFESGTFDPQRYEWNQGAVIDQLALNPPSGVRALHMDGNWAGGDELRSMPFDLTAHAGSTVVLRYAVQRTGSGDSPEPGEDLLVEYYSQTGQWFELRRITGSGPDETTFTSYADVLPVYGVPDAYRFRFRRLIGNIAAQDDFFIDDVRVLISELCPADIADSGTTGLPDGTVSVSDLLEVLANWGTNSTGATITAPLDMVDVFDLLELLQQWGDCV